MKTILIAAVALLATTAAHAATIENTKFTCHGVLNLERGFYEIVADRTDDDNDMPMRCMLDDAGKPGTKQILAVCHVGHYCIVRAIGVTGNGNGHAIDKVLEVRPDLDADQKLVNKLTQGWNPTPAGTPTNAPPTKAPSPYNTYSGILLSGRGGLSLGFKDDNGNFEEGEIRLPASERRRILQACRINQPCTVIGVSKPTTTCSEDCSNVVKIVAVFAGRVNQ